MPLTATVPLSEPLAPPVPMRRTPAFAVSVPVYPVMLLPMLRRPVPVLEIAPEPVNWPWKVLSALSPPTVRALVPMATVPPPANLPKLCAVANVVVPEMVASPMELAALPSVTLPEVLNTGAEMGAFTTNPVSPRSKAEPAKVTSPEPPSASVTVPSLAHTASAVTVPATCTAKAPVEALPAEKTAAFEAVQAPVATSPNELADQLVVAASQVPAGVAPPAPAVAPSVSQ